MANQDPIFAKKSQVRAWFEMAERCDAANDRLLQQEP